MNSELLNIQEISQYMGVKATMIYAMAEARTIPHYKIGRLLRFRKSEIDAWLRQNKRECLPSGEAAQRFLKKPKSKLDIGEIVHKSIDECKKERYNSPNGKTGPVKGLRKEVRDGIV